MMKIYSIRYADIIVGLVNKLIDIFKVNTTVMAHDRQAMLERYLIFTEYMFKVGLFLYAFASFGYFIYPIYSYVKFNKIVPILPSYLPFVDEDKTIGFTILTIFHLNVIVYGFLGSSCSDFSFTMVIVNVPILSKITCDNIIELNEILKEMRPNVVMIRAKLRNIILQHQEMAE